MSHVCHTIKTKPKYTIEEVESLFKKYFPKLGIDPEASTLNENCQYFNVVTKTTEGEGKWKLELESTRAIDEPVLAIMSYHGNGVIGARSMEGIEECLRSLQGQFNEIV